MSKITGAINYGNATEVISICISIYDKNENKEIVQGNFRLLNLVFLNYIY